MIAKLVSACLLPMVLVAGQAAAAGAPAAPTGLRCETLVNPLGIDTPRPRLSWLLPWPDRGARPTAYQVLVSESPEALRRGRGTLWDTGKVLSDQSIHLEYAGKALVSHARCWWKVRAWDEAGRPSGWSAPATWTMGILSPGEWQAQWISYTDKDAAAAAARRGEALAFTGARWIWSPDGDSTKDVPAGKRWFRRSFDLGGSVRWARVLLTVDDQFTLFLNGREVARSNGDGFAWRTPQEVDVAGYLSPGRNVVALEASNTAASPAGVIARLAGQLADGSPLNVVTDGTWRCSDQRVDGWDAPAFDDGGWQAARAIGPEGTAPWGGLRPPGATDWGPETPSPLLRKEVTVRKGLRSAVITLCGLGYYELRLNGAKVGDHELDPGYTRYDKRCLYVTHDLTRQMRRGGNALGVMLGNGWYNQHSREEWNFHNAPWRGRPRLLLHLRLEYADGSTETVVSEPSWRAATGPIVHDGIRNGEAYDARLEREGWDRPDYDDSGWAQAEAVPAPPGVLRAQMAPPIRVTETLQPVRVTEPQPGVFVFDMGQAFAGRARLRISGPAGTTVTLRYGERVRANGMVHRDEIQTLVYQGPFQTDTYTLKGRGEEVWESRFTYHGFRYVEVTGLPAGTQVTGLPSRIPHPTSHIALDGRVLHTDFPHSGSFECSNDLLNTIQRLTLWAYRSNFLSIPTDCPQREKNGWTGDAQLACEQAMYNFENSPAYAKWMNDFDDCQRPDGDLPGIVPTYDWGYGIGPAWDSAYFLIPWYLYVYRGDTRTLTAHYEGMKRYVDFLGRRSKDHIVSYGLGDWVPWKAETSVAVTGTAYYYVDALILARAARILGKADDSARYEALAGEIRQAFHKSFRQGDGLYANGTQTAQSCALYQGLADPAERPKVLARLAANIEGEGAHLDTGILGAKYVFHALSDGGQHDLAYRIATQTTPPSYGDWIRRGATTLWEDWRGGGSLNHIMFGDISAWFYQELAGIHADPEQPGFRHIILRPRPVADLRFARAQIETPYGELASAWHQERGTFAWHVVVPPNTTATLHVPARDPSSVTEGGRPIGRAPGVARVRVEDGAVVFEVPAGEYQFEALRG